MFHVNFSGCVSGIPEGKAGVEGGGSNLGWTNACTHARMGEREDAVYYPVKLRRCPHLPPRTCAHPDFPQRHPSGNRDEDRASKGNGKCKLQAASQAGRQANQRVSAYLCAGVCALTKRGVLPRYQSEDCASRRLVFPKGCVGFEHQRARARSREPKVNDCFSPAGRRFPCCSSAGGAHLRVVSA